jgi:hypothetical protein
VKLFPECRKKARYIYYILSEVMHISRNSKKKMSLLKTTLVGVVYRVMVRNEVMRWHQSTFLIRISNSS